MTGNRTRAGHHVRRGAHEAPRAGPLDAPRLPRPRGGLRRRDRADAAAGRVRAVAARARRPRRRPPVRRPPARPLPLSRPPPRSRPRSPSPRRSCSSTTGTTTSATDTKDAFEDKYGIKVTYDKFPDEPSQISKLQSDGKGGGYDISYPASTWVPSFVADGIIRPLDRTLIPNLANLAPEWQNPGYDPGNAHSVPNYWWTTGYAWNPDKITADLTTWAQLWDPALDNHMMMLDDMRECFAVGAFRLQLSPNTTDLGELDRILALLQEQKPLLKDYTDDDIGDLTGGQTWLTHCWSGDWWQMTLRRTGHEVRHPGRGLDQGQRRDGDHRRAPRTRSPRTCGSTSTSAPRSAPPTPTTSATWARTRRRCRSSTS